MRYKNYLLLILIPMALLACNNNQGENQASTLLSEARKRANMGEYEQSMDLLDSLNHKYPYAYSQKAMGERLADSICKKQSKLILDSLYNLQSEYKIVMYSATLSDTDKLRQASYTE